MSDATGGMVDELVKPSKILSWLFLVGFLFISNAARAVYSSHGVSPSARFEVLTTLAGVTFIWYWLIQQCTPYRVAFPLDLALFASSLWFLVLPSYLWRCERWRGLFKVAGIILACALAYVFGIMVHYALVWTSE